MKTNEPLESVLKQVLDYFKAHQDHVLGPSDITKEVGLYRGLNEKTRKRWGFTGSQNDRLAQGFINELLNREKIIRVKEAQSNGQVEWVGYQYKSNFVMRTSMNTKELLELLLKQVLELFKAHRDQVLGPSKITKGVGLYRGLNEEAITKWVFTGTHNDKLAQGFINELLNRDKITRVRHPQKSQDGQIQWRGYQYKSNFVIRRR